MKQHRLAYMQVHLDNGDALKITADDIQDLITSLEEAYDMINSQRRTLESGGLMLQEPKV